MGMGDQKHNLFEHMRIILPEHRRVMSLMQREREAARRVKPDILDDQWAEWEEIVRSAIEYRTSIRITLFTRYENVNVEGVPHMHKGKLYVDDTVIDTRQIIGVAAL